MAFFHVSNRMLDTLLQNMCSLAHATSSSTDDYGVVKDHTVTLWFLH